MKMNKAGVKLLNVNGRKEKQGANMQLAADLKFSTLVPASFLPFDLDGEVLAEHLWFDEGPHKGEPRFPTISNVSFGREFKGLDLSLARQDVVVDLSPCTMDKCKGTPVIGGQFRLEFRIQCNPTEEQIGVLFELMQEDVLLTVTEINGELLLS